MRTPDPALRAPATSRRARPRTTNGRRSSVATVAIVGGGFSGIMVAAHLLRGARERRDAALRVVLIERSPGFDGGAAYRTSSERHLLNVPAGRMGALPDDPTHFLRWLRATVRPDVQPGDYVPRGTYREYLRHVLDEARASAPPSASFEWLAGEAVDVVPAQDGGDASVVLRDGRSIAAQAVVLAVGNLPPAHPSAAERHLQESPFYVRDPWRGSALDVEPDEPVLLIGTGLTMLDYALALDERGHRGSLLAVSRRGLVPAGQLLPPTGDAADAERRAAQAERAVRAAEVDRQRTARGLVRAVRTAVRRAAKHGADWRDVIGALRPRTSALWQACSAAERARFLRHVRPYWDVARHRAAPAALERLQRLRAEGRLTVCAAQLQDFLVDDWGVTAILRLRGTGERLVARAAKVVNCTGPETRIARADHALLRALDERGLLRADPLGLGIETDADGFVVGADGRSSLLLAVGALNRGRLWESTAVEELRVQARDAAAVVLRRLAKRTRAAVAA